MRHESLIARDSAVVRPPSSTQARTAPKRLQRAAEVQESHGKLASLYARALWRTDPLADRAAGWIRRGHRAERFAAFQRGLSLGHSEIPAIAPLIAELFTKPRWLDEARMNLGARTCQRLGVNMLRVLGEWSLMNGYASHAAVKPLSFTGALTRSAQRRLAETGRYVCEVVQEDALLPGQPAHQISANVRLMHAMVRHAIWEARGAEAWRSEEWGAPINQADMLATIFEFSLLVLAGTRRLGFRFTERESEALVHLWRYAGFLMGVEERLLQELTSEARAVHFAELIYRVQPGPDQDSLDLARALREVAHNTPVPRWLRPLTTRLFDGYVHFHNGPIARDLQIPHASWRFVCRALTPSQRVIESLRVRSSTLDHWIWRTNAQAMKFSVARSLEGTEPSFR